jgi:hypothetical protein
MRVIGKIFVRLDSLLLKGLTKSHYRSYFVPKEWAKSLSILPNWNSFEIAYSNNSRPQLNAIFQKFSTDKGSLSPRRNDHAYADYYDSIFSRSRDKVLNVMEIGIGSNNSDIKGFMGVDAIPGASLRAWREYFPNATIYGADIDSRILFQEERIKTFYVDQTDRESIQKLWNKIQMDGPIEFDLIVDDGLHTIEAALTLLTESIEKLSVGGTYIVEDLEFRDIVKLENLVNQNEFLIQYVKFSSSERGLITGSLVSIRRNL